MSRTVVLIGPFERRVFAEGLAILLQDEPGLEVRLLADAREAAGLMDSPTPVVLILEGGGDADRGVFLPRSASVAVILITAEGADVQIALRQIDRSRLRAAIRLVSEAPHPRVIALDLNPPSQAPFALPNFRRSETSGLSQAIAWLDARFALALTELATERAGDAGAGWLGDLEHLVRGFSREGPVEREQEARHFAALMAAPTWPARLTRLFAFDPQELKLLCLAAAPDLDQRYAQAIGLLQNDYAASRPNATTLARLIGADKVGADIAAHLAGRRAFARLRLIRADDQGAPQPGYRVAPDLLAAMTGVRRQSGPGWRLQLDALPSQQGLAQEVAAILAAPHPPLVFAVGEAPGAADELAAAVIGFGARVLRVDGRALADAEDGRAMVDHALKAALSDAVLLVEGLDALPPERQAELIGADIAGLVPATIVGPPTPGIAGDLLTLRVPRPGPAEVARRWRSAADDHGLDLSEQAARGLGGTLRLPLAEIDAVARLAAARRRAGAEASDAALLLEAARGLSAAGAPETLRRAPCVFEWRDIVLSDAVRRQVVAIPEHVRHASLVLDDWDFSSRLPYGRGVGALFSGPSGTGKTMCAQVIARALGVDLLQVEISRCVSKYVGETEKNIDQCFAAAEAASAVLLFDELDALFGKRTEIKDAHDRHANVEVAYLLQRIEAYEGLVILTTNLKVNIDPAFLRRLRFVIDFPMPDAADRARIWQRAIPGAAPCAEDVDLAFLAQRLPLSGGSIQTIAVNAAFAAASEGSDRIHMRHLMCATQAELLKNGMLSAEKALVERPPRLLQEAGG